MNQFVENAKIQAQAREEQLAHFQRMTAAQHLIAAQQSSKAAKWAAWAALAAALGTVGQLIVAVVK